MFSVYCGSARSKLFCFARTWIREKFLITVWRTRNLRVRIGRVDYGEEGFELVTDRVGFNNIKLPLREQGHNNMICFSGARLELREQIYEMLPIRTFGQKVSLPGIKSNCISNRNPVQSSRYLKRYPYKSGLVSDTRVLYTDAEPNFGQKYINIEHHIFFLFFLLFELQRTLS